MQLREIIERHHGEHVVLDMIVHVGIEKTEHRIHDDGAGIQAMVKDILVQPRVLGEVEGLGEEAAIESRQHHEHGRQDRACCKARHDDAGDDK